MSLVRILVIHCVKSIDVDLHQLPPEDEDTDGVEVAWGEAVVLYPVL